MDFLKSGKFRFYILVFFCSLFFGYKIYRNSYPAFLTTWDVFGYYLYLPETFIYDDPAIKDFSRIEKIYDQYQLPGTIYQVNPIEGGNHAIKYSCGWAALNFPFFVGGHLYAKTFDYPTDGYSPPYQYALVISCIVYLALGLFACAMLLLRFFSPLVSAIVFFILVFGTNYYFIVTSSFNMPHLFLFTLYAFFLLFTDNWHRKKNYLNSILLGLTLALMTLVRPTEIIAALIPLFWGVFSWQEVKQRFRELFTTYRIPFILIAVTFIIVSFPQLYYWKKVTGSFLYNGYNNAGEGFEFLHPYTLKVLFSFRKGWIIYTPLAAFFIAGFFFMKKDNPWKKPLLIFFLLNLYIVSCWSNWWYQEGFSQRAMMHSFPILLIPFGALIQNRMEARRYLIFIPIVLLILLNQFQTWQANHGIIHGSRMTFAYYKAVFLKTYIPEGAEKLLLVDRSIESKDGFHEENYDLTTSYSFNFEKTDFEHVSKEDAHKGKKSCRLTPETPFSFCFEKTYEEITEYDHAWIRVSMWIKMSDSVQFTLPTLVSTFEFNGEPYCYRGFNLETDTNKTYLPNEWVYVESYYLTPEVRRKSDKFKAYLWLRGKGTVYADDMKIEIFEPKE